MLESSSRVRASEKARREGLTFADLCALVDRGRELGVDAEAVVSGDTWIRNKPDGRDGYRLRYLEV